MTPCPKCANGLLIPFVLSHEEKEHNQHVRIVIDKSGWLCDVCHYESNVTVNVGLFDSILRQQQESVYG